MAKKSRKKKKNARSTRSSAVSAPRGRPPKNATASRLLAQMASYRSSLISDRNSVQAQIESIESAMAEIGDASKGHKRRGTAQRSRGFREGSVKVFILKALKGKGEMAVKDVAKEVLRLGYTTTGGSFPNQVSNALAQMAEVTKTGRGRYRL